MNPLIPGGNSAPPGHAPKAVVGIRCTISAAHSKARWSRTRSPSRTSAKATSISRHQDFVRMHDRKSFEDPHRAGRREPDRGVVRHTLSEGPPGPHYLGCTNDPNNPQVVMTLQGMVKKQVEAEPDNIAFGDIKRGTEATKEMIVSDLNPVRGAFSVGPISNSNTSIKVDAGEASRRQARRAAESLATQDDAGRSVRRHDQNNQQSSAAAGRRVRTR